MAQTNAFDLLPNELIINALDSLPTRSLLPLAAVSRRFRGLVGRLHYYRLVEATALQGRQLILECYHPCDKVSTPSLFCKYIGTDGLTEAGEDADLEDLNRLYSRFKLYLGDENHRPRARWPTARVTAGIEKPLAEKTPSYDVNLDADELFTQLCAVTNLVKVGPRRGLFLSIDNVSDSVVRVWRDWLREQATRSAMEQQQAEATNLDDPSILWVDTSKNVGVRFRVIPREEGQTPLLLSRDQDPPVSYTLEYQELIVRTNKLQLTLETSEAQQIAHAGKAIIIASIT
ncbi:F-box domain-containing protein, variant [Xylaria bambusicola]|uniref:F-box domain-containing protein, variant n=1 Tax=Xylaria bambusicola TaxID=326684 RepID=UPI00200838B7|nr:F-box domain-containing protein, variant [Xylaria bambusicola]KAI0508782.1 F-box domain-containing protein, variant [Xylaria bambusicola]